MVDSRAHNPEAAGSNPVPATQKYKKGNKNNAINCDKDTI